MPNDFEPVTFTVGVDTYTLRMGFNAICDLEEKYDIAFPKFLADLSGPGMRFGRVLGLFHALLKREHPDMTEERAAALFEALGVEKATELMGTAVETSPLMQTAEKPARKPRSKAA